MPETNSRLKAIVHDAKLACRDKLKEASEKLDNDKVVILIDKVKAVFRKFDDAELWIKPLPFDESLLLEQTISISEAQDDDLAELTKAIDAFLKAFDEVTMTIATRGLTDTETSFWNARVLNALRKTRVSIDTRIEWFIANGHDPNEESGFPELADEQQKLIKAYRKALTEDKVEAKKTDVLVINKYEEVFTIVKELDKFITLYKSYNEVIKKRLPEEDSPGA